MFARLTGLLMIGLMLAPNWEAAAESKSLFAAKRCRGSMMGVTSGNAPFSTVDLTSSPAMSSSSTSGTSGCPNWDFATEADQVRHEWVWEQHPEIAEALARGDMKRLRPLTQLSGCPALLHQPIVEAIRQNPDRLAPWLVPLTSAQQTEPLWLQVDQVIADHPEWKMQCLRKGSHVR